MITFVFPTIRQFQSVIQSNKGFSSSIGNISTVKSENERFTTTDFNNLSARLTQEFLFFVGWGIGVQSAKAKCRLYCGVAQCFG